MRHDRVDLVDVLVEHDVALRLADALDDHLLGRLGRDPAQVEGDLDLALGGLFVGPDGAGTAVDADDELARGAVLLAGRGQECGFDSLEKGLRIDVLLTVNRVDDPKQLGSLHGPSFRCNWS